MSSDDLLTQAMRTTREAFVAQYPNPILVGDGALNQLPSAPATAILPAVTWEEATSATRRGGEAMPSPVISAIRKTLRTFPHMITVGRAPSNDIMIPDDSVSKFHAFFQRSPQGTGVALCDAGSTNGTWVDEDRLTPHGQPVEVRPGMRLRFARIRVTVVDSGAFWDRLHERTPQGAR